MSRSKALVQLVQLRSFVGRADESALSVAYTYTRESCATCSPIFLPGEVRNAVMLDTWEEGMIGT